MDKYPEMKGHYLVMDNAPIHSSTDIGKYIHSRGYRYVYLPPYSPELNPIEQFWSVVKNLAPHLTPPYSTLLQTVANQRSAFLTLLHLTPPYSKL
ncbi:hypothetical protein RO3G_06813 [Rhizopus delemar RA 99-880]|uniref:Tc1-like transposase DDE domain-containing protein n=1 Tax=Rhizopus delemar (strain RA 99-880 / ATCC MYA-4621 / FGSC 9543 / NRRL 43880) TaxID=246409 RepID=I1C0X8_RHIO9|nr:hypothetical protein RO3G_06813 [Rhizopus delemar RA 99-880]|eukprot:EIE82108.1 hypothetical protein RO3G_06813 [Rhizopus delemar RA 99-880]